MTVEIISFLSTIRPSTRVLYQSLFLDWHLLTFINNKNHRKDSEEEKITICAIYAPNRDTPRYFLEMGELLENYSQHKVLIGDLNLVLDTKLDRSNSRLQ